MMKIIHVDVIELAWDPYSENTGQVLFLFLFLLVMDRATSKVHKLAKKNETNVSSVKSERDSLIKVLSLRLYFKFPDGRANFIGKMYAKLFLLHNFHKCSAKLCGQTTRKRFQHNAIMFPFEYLFKNKNQ